MGNTLWSSHRVVAFKHSLCMSNNEELNTDRIYGFVTNAYKERRQRNVPDEFRGEFGYGDVWSEFDLVVTTEVGMPVDPSNARQTLDRLCDEAKIGHWNPNALRHSFASLMSSCGATMEEVADAMGRADTRMTSRVYRHNLKSVVDVAVVHFDILL